MNPRPLWGPANPRLPLAEPWGHAHLHDVPCACPMTNLVNTSKPAFTQVDPWDWSGEVLFPNKESRRLISILS
jgi:hypothetical protein